MEAVVPRWHLPWKRLACLTVRRLHSFEGLLATGSDPPVAHEALQDEPQGEGDPQDATWAVLIARGAAKSREWASQAVISHAAHG